MWHTCVCMEVGAHAWHKRVWMWVHVCAHAWHTCVWMWVCVHTCALYVLTSWALAGPTCVWAPAKPCSRRSSFVLLSYFSAFKTLAVSSRKLCLCGNEMPRAARPSYWLIDDMIPRGSPVVPRNALYFLLSPPPCPPSPTCPLGSDLRDGAGAAPREARAVALVGIQPASTPGLSLTWILQLCAQKRSKGHLGLFCL